MICLQKRALFKRTSSAGIFSENSRRVRSIFARGIILAVTIFILSACAVFPSREPLTVYVLRPSALETQIPRCECTMQVHRPKAGGVLNSAKIVVMPEPQQLSVYKGVRWDEVLPSVVQDYLVDSFRSSAVFSAVIDSETRVGTDYYLDSTMRSFQSSYVRAAENGGNPVIEVEFAVQLIEAKTSTVIAQHNFIVLQPSTGTEVDTVVRAFNGAAANLSLQVLEWTATSITQRKLKE
ncbi:MAG: ABC-type transport auxiliary lipoprotein family protein [Desulfuromonadaceae bacterium]|nr:ABC-type transport auxiliary lipoprotein family protein [Desulfuromonadaceae bacterium]